MKHSRELIMKIDSLAVFKELRRDPVIRALRQLLESFSIADYSCFVSELYQNTENLSEYVQRITLRDDNFYIKAVASGMEPDTVIHDAVKNELMALEEIASVTPGDIRNIIRQTDPEFPEEFFLPSWKTTGIQLFTEFTKKLGKLSSTGYGIFAGYVFFRITDGEILPVIHPDYQRLDQLFGYERERNLIIRNTEALIEGTGSNNMLLYGDMGTGKSSTIKAVAAAFADRGLRIIEIKKNQLFQIPELMDQLASNPLKFILFIDDLSFSGSDDNFSALKATLEGSISGCGNNTAIYATSNRRHLVRELASDRYGNGIDDDLHVNDTLQETMSLAARFGLTITYMKPEREEYLSIVKSLANQYGIALSKDPDDGLLSEEELFRKAEAHAIRRNGRSPRTAKQFIELLKIGI